MVQRKVHRGAAHGSPVAHWPGFLRSTLGRMRFEDNQVYPHEEQRCVRPLGEEFAPRERRLYWRVTNPITSPEGHRYEQGDPITLVEANRIGARVVEVGDLRLGVETK